VESKNGEKRPGGPAGMAAVLPGQFKVSAMPAIGVEAAMRILRETIQKENLRCESLAVSGSPARRGSLRDMSGAPVPFPEGKEYERCYVGFVDPDVDAEWGHPAHWVFLPAEGNGTAALQDTDLPELPKGPVRMFRVPRR
jgi:hypothetical protein